jgi:hypothetical protein
MIILSKEEVTELRQFVIGAAHPPVTRDELYGLCDTAELGLRAIEVLRRLDEIDDGSPITDRVGDGSTYASEELEAVLNDAAAIVAEAQATK